MSSVAENIPTKDTENKPKRKGSFKAESPMKSKMDPENKMCAISWQGKKDVKVMEVPKPRISDPKDIILRVTCTSICGSDIHRYKNAMPDTHTGDLSGHECIGIVAEVGSKVKKLNLGQRVCVSYSIACGKCEFCKRKEYPACEFTNPSKMAENISAPRQPALYGYSHFTGGAPGGHAEYLRVPLADFNCLPLPDQLPDHKAILLADLLPTAYYAVECANFQKGDTVAIWGLGPVGMMTALLCQYRRASCIIGIDNVPKRLEMAKDLLGISVIDFSQEDTCDTLLKRLTHGVDCAIECAGFDYPKSWKHKVEMALNLETDSSDIFKEIFGCVRKFGRVSVIGVYLGLTNHFPIGTMMEKALTVRGGQAPVQKYWKQCLDLISSGEVDPSFIVTDRGKLSDIPDMLKKLSSDQKAQGSLKVVLDV